MTMSLFPFNLDSCSPRRRNKRRNDVVIAATTSTISTPKICLFVLILSLIFNVTHPLEQQQQQGRKYKTQRRQQQQQQQQQQRKPRVLMGIFSADVIDDTRYRNIYRTLLNIHPLVCILNEYLINTTEYEQCELIYTFVIGTYNTNDNDSTTTRIVDNTTQQIVSPTKPIQHYSSDFEQYNDFTFLNIKENMNQGKSETWFYYSSIIMKQYTIIDYVMKIDTDSMIYLDRYFHFVYNTLPSYPYNTRVLAGAPVDKVWWTMTPEQIVQKESFFTSQYSSLHLYAAGQMYIVSKDLASAIATVAAATSKNDNDNDITKSNYKEGHEDHDVSTMIFLSTNNTVDKPIRYIILPYSNPFWKHPLKIKHGISKWKQTWDTEIAYQRKLYPSTLKENNSNKGMAATYNTQKKTTTLSTNAIVQSSSLPNITRNDTMNWFQQLQEGQFTTTTTILDDVYYKLNTVQINNTIADKDNCFLQNNGGYLVGEHIHVLQWHGDGGQYWSEFTALIPNNTDIILLNKMNVYSTTDDINNSNTMNTIHTVQQLAVRLNMNYANVVTSIELNTTGTGIQYSGEAILSKCYIYDPIIYRVFDSVPLMKKQQKISSDVALLVRTGIENNNNNNNNHNFDDSLNAINNHIVVGTVQKLSIKETIRNSIWEYQFGYSPTTQYQKRGIAQYNQLGSIIGGIILRDQCERIYGLRNVDYDMNYRTHPSNCYSKRRGYTRYSTICSNFIVKKEDSPLLPCYYNSSKIDTNGKKKILQISNHSIISIRLH